MTPSSKDIERSVRTQQVRTLYLLLPMALVGHIVSGICIAMSMWKEHASVLGPWLLFTGVVWLAALLQARKATTRLKTRHASRRYITVITRNAAAIGFIITSGPCYLLMHSSGIDKTLLICDLTGLLWAGAYVLTTVKPAVIAFLITSTCPIILSLLACGWTTQDRLLVFLFVLGSMLTFWIAKRQNAVFVGSNTMKFELEAKNDTIKLLLKDYEEQTSDWLWEVDHDLRLVAPSPRFADALSCSMSGLDGKTLTAAFRGGEPVDGQGLEDVEAALTARIALCDNVIATVINGKRHWFCISGRPVASAEGIFRGYRGVISDVSAAKEAEHRLAYLAHHDALTSLANRVSFQEQLDIALRDLGDETIAVVSLDLDGFKSVNDRFGHPAGDRLLIEVAARLRSCTDENCLVSRFGGDEFVLLCRSALSVERIEHLCKAILKAICTPVEIDGRCVVVGAGIGVALAPKDGQTSETLLKNADAALYEAKTARRANPCFYTPDADTDHQKREHLLRELREAIAKSEFVLFYQPFVDVKTGFTSGYEALVRWQHPTRGLVGPVEFVAIAEASGLIVPLGQWILLEACREAAKWPGHLRVAVNISPAQLIDAELPMLVLNSLVTSGLSPTRLELEITEAVLIEDPVRALATINQIKSMGVRIALDDFGIGFSSLSYLTTFPFDKIKIDRSFISEFDKRRDNQVIVRAIRDIAHGLNMTLTAEGVETIEQQEELRATGCEELQGFLYARPQPAEALSTAQRRRRSHFDDVNPASEASEAGRRTG